MLDILAAAALAPPPAPPPAAVCVCTARSRKPDIEFRGVAVDGAFVVAPDGAADPRQATIFRVVKAFKGEAATPMKVWHLRNPERCCVIFNYASTYEVKARLKAGKAETDLCLMPELKPKSE